MTIFKSLNDRQKASLDRYAPTPRLIDKWYDSATMTHGHAYHVEKLDSRDDVLWPDELIPYLKECDWKKMSHAQALRARVKAANGYLGTTVKLEPHIIIPICQTLASGEPSLLKRFYMPKGLRLALLQVKTDEGLHETISASQLVELDVPEDGPDPHYMVGLSAALQRAHGTGLDEMMIKLLFGCVTELSVTKFLGYATSPNVHYHPGLKAAIIAHEQDERYHAGVFGGLFQLFFAQLDEPWRELYAGYIPTLLKAFLMPDESTARWVLSDLFDEAEVAQRINAAYPEAESLKAVISDGKGVINIAEKQGLFDYDSVKQAFIDEGLENAISAR